VKTWSEVWPAASGTGGALPLPKSRPQPILLPPILLPKTLVLGSLSRQAPLALVPSLCRPFTSLPCGHPCPKCPSPSLPCPQDPSSLYSVPPTFSQSCLTSLFVSPGHTHLKKQDITSGLKSYPCSQETIPPQCLGALDSPRALSPDCTLWSAPHLSLSAPRPNAEAHLPIINPQASCWGRVGEKAPVPPSLSVYLTSLTGSQLG
jgi:hypothetical protein